MRIGIDCEPFSPRPGSYISGVVKDTPLEKLPELDPEATTSRLFGAWIWEFDLPVDELNKIHDLLDSRIKSLYHNGLIRGAILTNKGVS